MKLAAKQLRVSEPTELEKKKIKRRPIYIVCDNILDTYNLGSIFRLADAVAASKVYLCAGSETPPNTKIARASVGTDKWVPWEYKASASEAISNIKSQISNVKIIAIEQNPKAIDFRKLDCEPLTVNSELAVAFVLGHETTGLSAETLKLCDEIVEIPMFGINKSLNVMVSLAIVLFQIS